MGGDITVESAPGAGSRFSLWLATPDLRSGPRDTRNASRAHDDAEDGTLRAARKHLPGASMTPPRPMFAVPMDEGASVVRLGELLMREIRNVMAQTLTRLRDSPVVPTHARTDAELEDHGASFIHEIALAVRTMGEATGESAARLRDGTAIMALVAERHGAQRAGLGWPEAAIHDEFRILDDVLRTTMHQVASAEGTPAYTTERVSTIVAQLLEQGKRLSVSGYRLEKSMD
jgi:hypothetical protein